MALHSMNGRRFMLCVESFDSHLFQMKSKYSQTDSCSLDCLILIQYVGDVRMHSGAGETRPNKSDVKTPAQIKNVENSHCIYLRTQPFSFANVSVFSALAFAAEIQARRYIIFTSELSKRKKKTNK